MLNKVMIAMQTSIYIISDAVRVLYSDGAFLSVAERERESVAFIVNGFGFIRHPNEGVGGGGVSQPPSRSLRSAFFYSPPHFSLPAR